MTPDPIEHHLRDMADRLQAAWRNNQCLTCPLGELAALARATLIFYQEQQRQRQDELRSYWTKRDELHNHWTKFRNVQ